MSKLFDLLPQALPPRGGRNQPEITMKKTKKLTVRAAPIVSIRTQYTDAEIRKVRLAAAKANQFPTAFAKAAILSAAEVVR